jgi:Primase C terminal 2 (PriCT-2)
MARKRKPPSQGWKTFGERIAGDFPAWSPQAEERVRSALKTIPNSEQNSLDYDTWLRILIALHSTRWEPAYDLARRR